MLSWNSSFFRLPAFAALCAPRCRYSRPRPALQLARPPSSIHRRLSRPRGRADPQGRKSPDISRFRCLNHINIYCFFSEDMLASAVASESGVIVVSMADHRANIDIVGPRPWFFNVVGRSEPDLRLLKQVEQVTNIDFGRTGPALCQDSEHGDHRRGRSPRISDSAITGLAVVWLQKQPGGGPRATVCEAAGPLQRRSAMPPVKLSHYP